ncbi:MAG: DMT family transporter [Paracoccaceae bacterium]
MNTDIKVDRRANWTGSLWMVGAMAGFAIEDAFLKASAAFLPIGQILILFGIGGVVLFGGFAIATGQPLMSRDVISRPMRIRVFFEIIGRLFYILALSLTPLSSTTVILQATPIVVVACAAVLFGETVGWRRWAAILIGLLGIVVIIRPGTDSFSMLSLLAVAGMIGFAGRDLASRAAPASLGTAILGLYGFLSVLIAGVCYAIWAQTPLMRLDTHSTLFLIGAILAGVAAYASLMKAMRTGEVSAVTPFRYTRLLFGIALGVFMFGEQLTAPMIVGCALIVLSGLFILWRGQASTTR